MTRDNTPRMAAREVTPSPLSGADGTRQPVPTQIPGVQDDAAPQAKASPAPPLGAASGDGAGRGARLARPCREGAP